MAGQSVFQVHAHGPGGDDLGNRRFQLFQVGGEAGFDIGGDRHLDGAGHAADRLKHLRPGKVLPVGEAHGVGDGGAAAGDGRQSAVLHHGRAGRVPGVDQHQRTAAMMQFQQPGGLLCLRDGLRLRHKQVRTNSRLD